MEAKLCIIHVGEDQIEAYIIPKNKQKAAILRKVIWIDKFRFPKNLNPQSGQVYEVSYDSRMLAVDRLTEESFFKVQAEAIQHVVYEDYEIGDTQEIANQKYEKNLINKKTRERTLKRSECKIREINF